LRENDPACRRLTRGRAETRILPEQSVETIWALIALAVENTAEEAREPQGMRPKSVIAGLDPATQAHRSRDKRRVWPRSWYLYVFACILEENGESAVF
jgi:hypothetical protein